MQTRSTNENWTLEVSNIGLIADFETIFNRANFFNCLFEEDIHLYSFRCIKLYVEECQQQWKGIRRSESELCGRKVLSVVDKWTLLAESVCSNKSEDCYCNNDLQETLSPCNAIFKQNPLPFLCCKSTREWCSQTENTKLTTKQLSSACVRQILYNFGSWLVNIIFSHF